MTQKEFVKAVAAETNKALKEANKTAVSENTVNEVVKAEVSVATKALAKNDKIQISGFGTFGVSKRDARTGRNPLTGETIKISAKNCAKFKAAKALKEALN